MALVGLVVWQACCDLGWWQWLVSSTSPAALLTGKKNVRGLQTRGFAVGLQRILSL
jgi:hypothetical protein